MAVDFSKNVFELFSGKKRTRPGATLAIAVVVTALVAVPLTLRAVDARNNPEEREVVLAPAESDLIVVDTAEQSSTPLDLASVSGPILVSLREDDASAVSFRLFAAGSDEPILDSRDIEGPRFDMVVDDSGAGSPFDSTLLRNGSYELFVTIRTPKEDRRTAVSFDVSNP